MPPGLGKGLQRAAPRNGALDLEAALDQRACPWTSRCVGIRPRDAQASEARSATSRVMVHRG